MISTAVSESFLATSSPTRTNGGWTSSSIAAVPAPVPAAGARKSVLSGASARSVRFAKDVEPAAAVDGDGITVVSPSVISTELTSPSRSSMAVPMSGRTVRQSAPNLGRNATSGTLIASAAVLHRSSLAAVPSRAERTAHTPTLSPAPTVSVPNTMAGFESSLSGLRPSKPTPVRSVAPLPTRLPAFLGPNKYAQALHEKTLAAAGLVAVAPEPRPAEVRVPVSRGPFLGFVCGVCLRTSVGIALRSCCAVTDRRRWRLPPFHWSD